MFFIQCILISVFICRTGVAITVKELSVLQQKLMSTVLVHGGIQSELIFFSSMFKCSQQVQPPLLVPHSPPKYHNDDVNQLLDQLQCLYN